MNAFILSLGQAQKGNGQTTHSTTKKNKFIALQKNYIFKGRYSIIFYLEI